MNLSKHVLFLSLILYLHSAITLGIGIPVKADPPMLKVPDDYLTIQEAINNARSGEIIFVRKGTYVENIIINKSITLVGEDQEGTIIDGGAKGNVILIKASNVTVKGFTIRNSDPIIGCGISAERFGNITIKNNIIKDNNIGIQISSSSRNQIYENVISSNYIGIQLFYSSINVICRNFISNNTDGIDVFYYSISNIFYENVIYRNTWGVYLSFFSNNNVFYHNNFMKNVYDVHVEQTVNTWCYNNEGNYWDSYEGKDSDKNGIGDTQYVIAGKNIDYYPLMGRYYTFTAHFKGKDYRITIISNSTISNFAFKVLTEFRTRVILFNVSCTYSPAGFCKIVIPKILMENIHAVLLNDEEVNATLIDTPDAENSCLFIEYLGNCSIKIVYLELLDLYYQLLDKIHNLNNTNDRLVKEINTLNKTLNNLIINWNDFQELFLKMNSLYQIQTQNLRNLAYVFALATAIFIIVTVYLSYQK